MNYVGPASLYNFLRQCNASPLPKVVLDCGAGGKNPPLTLFHQHGYQTLGVEFSDSQAEAARKFGRKNGIDLNIVSGDMRHLPFADGSISFIYLFNTIFHMSKEESAQSLKEIERVLPQSGLCFVNFLSVEDGGYGEGKKLAKGEFWQQEEDYETIHSYYEDDEADNYFTNFMILRKEKRIVDEHYKDKQYHECYIDYIVQKL